MSELELRNAPEPVRAMLADACKELATKGHDVTPERLLAIRQRQATGEVHWDDPPVTTVEAPERKVMVKQANGKFEEETFNRDETLGLSPLDSAVRKMRSAAYAYNEGDYTATFIMAREAFLEVVEGLKDKTYMATDITEMPKEVEGGD